MLFTQNHNKSDAIEMHGTRPYVITDMMLFRTVIECDIDFIEQLSKGAITFTVVRQIFGWRNPVITLDCIYPFQRCAQLVVLL